jgi:CRP-like cAMP-binding protein
VADTNEITFQAGDVVFDSTQPSNYAYFIMDGSVEIELSLGVKNLKLITGPNQFIGDAAVVVNEKADRDAMSYRGRAVALETVRAIAIPIADLRHELESCPPLIKAWIASFTSRVLVVIEELSKDA